MNIKQLHEEIFHFLITKHKEDTTFKFTTRRNNRWERLKKGYWFIGGEDYLELSFWEGKDSFAKINNIGFTVLLRRNRNEVYFNFSCKDGKACFLIEKISSKLKVYKSGNPLSNYWEKTLVGNLQNTAQVITALKGFINHEKKVIDDFIKENPNKDISFISDDKFIKQLETINKYRITS